MAFASNFEESIGTSVMATTREAISENDTVKASGVNKSDAIPCVNTIGKNTTNVVVVDAITAGVSSAAPLVADSNKLCPRCLYEYIFSKITIELSTIIPIPSASPPSVNMLSVSPVKYMSAKVEIIAIGIDKPITIVARILFRKSNKIKMDMAPPIKIFEITESTASSINSDVSIITSNSTPSGNSAFNPSKVPLTFCATSTVLESVFFMTDKTIDGSPFTSVTSLDFLKVSFTSATSETIISASVGLSTIVSLISSIDVNSPVILTCKSWSPRSIVPTEEAVLVLL